MIKHIFNEFMDIYQDWSKEELVYRYNKRVKELGQELKHVSDLHFEVDALREVIKNK